MAAEISGQHVSAVASLSTMLPAQQGSHVGSEFSVASNETIPKPEPSSGIIPSHNPLAAAPDPPIPRAPSTDPTLTPPAKATASSPVASTKVEATPDPVATPKEPHKREADVSKPPSKLGLLGAVGKPAADSASGRAHPEGTTPAGSDDLGPRRGGQTASSILAGLGGGGASGDGDAETGVRGGADKGGGGGGHSNVSKFKKLGAKVKVQNTLGKMKRFGNEELNEKMAEIEAPM